MTPAAAMRATGFSSAAWASMPQPAAAAREVPPFVADWCGPVVGTDLWTAQTINPCYLESAAAALLLLVTTVLLAAGWSAVRRAQAAVRALGLAHHQRGVTGLEAGAFLMCCILAVLHGESLQAASGGGSAGGASAHGTDAHPPARPCGPPPPRHAGAHLGAALAIESLRTAPFHIAYQAVGLVIWLAAGISILGASKARSAVDLRALALVGGAIYLGSVYVYFA